MGRLLVLIACVAAGVLLAARHLTPPSPLPATAPATVFSAERAMNDVRTIARAPHPTASPANRAVREHLLARLRALGAEASVQRAAVVTSQGLGGAGRGTVVGAEVENVVGVLPGRDRGRPAIFLMSHYDSVPGSPGAADDALGVAASLEVARALGAERGRDLILLFTDGEELGLLGARAFFAEHPLARRVGTVINLEARGSSGPVMMFETGARNAELMALYDAAVERPSANSLTAFIYDRLPNDTDFSVPLDRGLPGLNLAAVADQRDYHSPSATPANLDRRTLQHMGDQTLAATRALLAMPAEPPRTADAVYFDAPLLGLIRYPPWVGWAVIGAGAALLALGLRSARARGVAPWSAAALGAVLWVAIVGATALALTLVRARLPDGSGLAEMRPILVQFPLYEAACVLLAIFGVLFAASLLLRRRRGRPVDPTGVWGGLVAVTLLLAMAVQLFAPAAAFLLAWPGVVAALGLAVTAGERRNGGPARWLALALGVVAFAALAALGHLVLVTLPEQPAALAALTVLSAVVLWPVIHPVAAGRGGYWVTVVALVAGVACTVVLTARTPWTPRSPQASQAIHLADPARGRWLRVSALPTLDPWSRAALSLDGDTPLRRPLPEAHTDSAWTARARPFASTPLTPTAARLSDGRVLIDIPRWRGRELRLTLASSVALRDVTVAGRPTPLRPHALGARLRWTGEGPLRLTFRPSGPGTLDLAAVVVADGPPPGAEALPPRPASVAPWNLGDTTLTVSRLRARF